MLSIFGSHHRPCSISPPYLLRTNSVPAPCYRIRSHYEEDIVQIWRRHSLDSSCFFLPALFAYGNDANLIVFLELLVNSLDLLSIKLKTKSNNLVFFALSFI